MSFNRLSYDTCTYKTNLRQSVGVGDHLINMPKQDCVGCFSSDPNLRLAHFGGATCQNKPLVDVDSELIGLTRKASACPLEHYRPSAEPFCNMTPLQDCRAIPREDTRMSNPPCTLRGTGINRWEWLCHDPQTKAVMPFERLINNRIVVKDNHRPCIPNPINQAPILPPNNASQEVVGMAPMCSQGALAPNQHIPSTHWKPTSAYGDYLKTWA